MQPKKIIVQKFGGSSLASAECFRRIPSLLNGKNEAIVLSAAANTTSLLKSLLHHNNKRNKQEQTEKNLKILYDFQSQLINDLIKATTDCRKLLESLDADCQSLHKLLEKLSPTHKNTHSIIATILGFGEIWSCRLMTAFLKQNRPVKMIDTSKVLFVKHHHGLITVDWQKSSKTLDTLLANKTYDQLIITGFIATTENNTFTTLGENGSDFSAAIFAKLLHATALHKWTNVDGIFSADPSKVKSAQAIQHLSYKEALELAYFCAHIIHPLALQPALDEKIPIYIKNFQHPVNIGTIISDKKAYDYL